MKTTGDTFLVTGGAGFIGSATVEYLLSKGSKVSVLDNFSTGRRENLDFRGVLDEAALSLLTVFEGDIRNVDDTKKAMQGARYVIHQAALTSLQQSVRAPLLANSVNVDGFLNCLVLARDLGVKRLVLASSSSVYGNSQELPNREEAKLEPASPYAVTKAIGEKYCRMFDSIYGLETVVLRYFNVFGPRQDPNSEYAAVIPAFIKKLLMGERPIVYGDGKQSRDFIYVGDVAAANHLACVKEGASGGVFNIASGRSRSLEELLSALSTITGSRELPVHAEERPCDVKHSWACTDEARKELGFVPKVSFEESLKATVSYFRKEMTGRVKADR
ncbi:MAG: SDR family oxidoreductase [Candidatus Eisenbacteria bacterium]|nr:SDR family oxidoreductase [Candidatus Eisenbacteria bacterium]